MGGKKAAGSTKIIATAVITFVLVLMLGIATSPLPSQGGPVTVTKQEMVTATLSAKGQPAFKLPKGERPVKLTYEDKTNDISGEVANLPPPSREVTYVYAVDVDIKFEFHNVIVLVKDELNNPVKGAFVKAFSHSIGGP